MVLKGREGVADAIKHIKTRPSWHSCYGDDGVLWLLCSTRIARSDCRCMLFVDFQLVYGTATRGARFAIGDLRGNTTARRNSSKPQQSVCYRPSLGVAGKRNIAFIGLSSSARVMVRLRMLGRSKRAVAAMHRLLPWECSVGNQHDHRDVVFRH
jgi:hypothetical protein